MKFRVFPLGIFASILLDVLGLINMLFVIFLPSSKELWMWVFFPIMFIIFPILITFYFFSFANDMIVINENGIEKYHFGKLKKTLSWSNVVTAKIYSPIGYSGWVYLSDFKVHYGFFSSIYMGLDKKTICIYSNKKIIDELNKYLSKKIIIK